MERTTTYSFAALWKGKALLTSHLIIVLLFGSWLFPLTRVWWDALDQATFIQLNKWILKSTYWQAFFALADHKISDWFFDIIIACFLGSYIIQAPRHLRIRRLAESLFCIIVAATTILFFNRYILIDVIPFIRHSPSLVSPMQSILTEVIPSLHLKTSARNSFPGDHATLGLFFIFMMHLLLSRKKALLATGFGIIFILPRLIIGAHWLTDILIGSVSLVLFVIAWTFYTPFYHTVVSKLESFLRLFVVKRDA